MKIIEEIARLKKEKNAIILVHNYQRPEIQDIADFLGDSLGLAREAVKTDARTIVFCGVRFMAETAKILSPEKIVLLPRNEAGCPMADMITVEEVRELKEKYPDAEVVSYVNTNADVKAESDVCCTSANAVEVVRNVKAERVIFTPDKKRFLIGTEEGLIYRLKKENPGKEFYAAGTAKMCRNMKLTTLNNVYLSLKEERYAIELPEGIINSAKKVLEAMLKYA